MRKTHEELQKIKNRYNVEKLWSWSRINTYNISKYEYFLKYIIHAKEDRDNCAYAPYGTLSHNILEDFYSKKIIYSQMEQEFEDGLFTLELAELKFDRNNEEKDKSTKEKYLYDLRHFFKNYKPIEYKVTLEQFLIIKIGNNILNGYLDCAFKDNDNCYNIVDFKTSSIYKGEKILKESGQLLLYALGLSQMGVPLDKIKICWNFLKYCDVLIEQANGKFVNRHIERVEIGNTLKSNCTMWLRKLGYEDEVENYIDILLKTNGIGCLPEDVQKKYVFSDCYVYIELNKDVINNLKISILNTIAEIEKKENEYRQNLDETIFYDSEESVESQSYYFNTLCSYSARLHKPFKMYLEKLEKKKKTGIFDDVGEEVSDEDMEWLNSI